MNTPTVSNTQDDGGQSGKPNQPQSIPSSELNPVDGYLLELLGDYHRHLCVSCDGAENGCINCRHTGYDQIPCKICDKDGIAFRNRREFLDKVSALIDRKCNEAREFERKQVYYVAHDILADKRIPRYEALKYFDDRTALLTKATQDTEENV